MLRVFGSRLPLALRSRLRMEAQASRDARRTGYLAMMGVAPEWQGRGLGTALMQPGLDDARRGRRAPPTSRRRHPRSRALYRRNGFEVTGELSLPRAARRSG